MAEIQTQSRHSHFDRADHVEFLAFGEQINGCRHAQCSPRAPDVALRDQLLRRLLAVLQASDFLKVPVS